jgi:hypothetical protein
LNSSIRARVLFVLGALLASCASPSEPTRLAVIADGVVPTRVFEVRDDRAYLGGAPVELWGIRAGNALFSPNITERHVRALDGMVAHGINTIAVYMQGSNGGYPNPEAGKSAFRRDGTLRAEFAERLEWLVREADSRGMVVAVGIISPRKDQDLADEVAIRRAVQETGRFLVERGLSNTFVDIVHEFSHSRIDHDLLREPNGERKKQQLTAWFREVAPNIPVGVCPYELAPTADTYPGMGVRIIQKEMPIPTSGFVVNIESQKQDSYENDGVFSDGMVQHVIADCERFAAAPNAAFIFHAAYIQGINNGSHTAPHPEMGGMGATVGDRGVRFYYEWVRDHVGVWQYPRHVPYVAVAADSAPTREFEVRDGRAYLGGEAVKLWGLRANNSLMSPALTQRLVANLDNYAAHGINLISVSLQGTNGGFPDVDAGPNGFTPDGRLIAAFGRRLEQVIRAADARGMVVSVVLMMPRKDELLRDEAAVRQAIESSARFLEERGLRNVIVNLYQEFNHPTRIDHEIFREPDGAAKKAQLAAWFDAIAPDIEVGIVSNHLSGSGMDFPGCDVRMYHEAVPIPDGAFSLNTETPDEDMSGNEGVFNSHQIANMQATWERYAEHPDAAMLFRSPYVEDVGGVQGTGPNLEMGGFGTGPDDRGIRVYLEWVAQHVGRWEYPVHVPR